ncbi:hypothetical protein BD413DRAFT_603104 [Trametes elegans]|nr:hypothetical protein BD413DRAFT_603104 [Trametes elegans]
MSGDPNFPSDLDIHPLASASSDSDVRFDSVAQEGAIKTYGIAGRIWEASHAMLAYLDPSSPFEFDPSPGPTTVLARDEGGATTAIELGSGTGFVAARVAEWLRPERDLLIATDLPDVCALLEMNLHACPAVRVRPLAWGSGEHARRIADELGLGLSTNPHLRPDVPPARGLTHVLCSDLIYFPALLAPLLRSLIHLTSPPFVSRTAPAPAIVILSYKIRSLSKETPFWSAFGLWFEFVPVLARRRRSAKRNSSSPPSGEAKGEPWSRFSPGGESSDETFVLVAERRLESLDWIIPEADTLLLSGVGAQGSQFPKTDDQFEQLLLMGMDVS